MGGRQKGRRDKKLVAREQLAELLLKSAHLDPAEVEALQPLAVMRFVMASCIKAGDYKGALIAAEAAAPYVHSRLASADVRVTNTQESMSDEELKAEIALLEARIKAAETLN
jgi:hypothetical protein